MKKSRKRSSRSNNRPLILIGLGLLLMAAAVVIVVTNPFGEEAAVVQPNSQSDIPFPEVERVELDAAQDAFETGQAIFVDTRDPESFLQGSIPGAINIPVNEVENRVAELNPDDWIITYCT